MWNEEKSPHANVSSRGGDFRYRELVDVDRTLALKTFEHNRDFYNPICRGMVEKDLYGK